MHVFLKLACWVFLKYLKAPDPFAVEGDGHGDGGQAARLRRKSGGVTTPGRRVDEQGDLEQWSAAKQSAELERLGIPKLDTRREADLRAVRVDRYTSHVIFLMHFARLIVCILTAWLKTSQGSKCLSARFIPFSCHP